MDADAKKTALRMIPYGLYVLTAERKNGKCAAATVKWVTKNALHPAMVVVGLKSDSGVHPIINVSKNLALDLIGNDQIEHNFTLCQQAEVKWNT